MKEPDCESPGSTYGPHGENNRLPNWAPTLQKAPFDPSHSRYGLSDFTSRFFTSQTALFQLGNKRNLGVGLRWALMFRVVGFPNGCGMCSIAQLCREC